METNPDILRISGTTTPGILTPINLQDNNSLTIDLNPIVQSNPNNIILKIIVDWGDNSPCEEFSRFNESFVASHAYHNTTGNLMAKISAFNVDGEKIQFFQHIDIHVNSILQNGEQFNLVSANITNDNNVAYVLTDVKSKVTISVIGKR